MDKDDHHSLSWQIDIDDTDTSDIATRVWIKNKELSNVESAHCAAHPMFDTQADDCQFVNKSINNKQKSNKQQLN